MRSGPGRRQLQIAASGVQRARQRMRDQSAISKALHTSYEPCTRKFDCSLSRLWRNSHPMAHIIAVHSVIPHGYMLRHFVTGRHERVREMVAFS